MTGLEIILSIILYIALGLWIAFKRNWYEYQADDTEGQFWLSLISVVLMPINLIIVFVREFIIAEWDN